MTKRTATKRSLILSFLSLLLCFSMLIGTTYAWFTDSVTSNNNIIKSGNLDVELEYAKVVDGQITGWATVQDEDEIFDPNALWEPGRVEVVYLKVSNLGSLALKYQLGVNVVNETTGTNVEGDEFKLSDSLVFKAVLMNDALETYTDREAVALAAGTEKGLKDYNGTTTALDPKDGENDEDYVALIVYMPETVGNEANYRGTDVPTILLGINLYATQQTAEEDSFDKNYDEGAWNKAMKVTSFEELRRTIENAEDGDLIVFANDIKNDDGILITDKNITIDLNGKTFTVSEGASTNNRNFKINGASQVTIQNGTLVAGGDMSSGAYGTIRTEDSANVTLSDMKLYNYRGNGLNIKAFVGTTVNINDTEIYSQYGGGVEAAGGTVELNNVKVEQKGMWNAPYNSMAISVNGGGKAIVNSGTYTTECLAAADANNQGTSHGPFAVGVLNSGGTLVINGGTFSNDNFGENSLAAHARGLVLADTGAVIEINGGVFNALKGIIDIQNNLGDASRNPSVILADGTFSADPTASKYNYLIKVVDGYKVVNVAEGWIIIPSDRDYVQNGVFVSTDEKTYFIANADGFAWMADQADAFFAGKTVKLDADIDFGGKTINETRFWEPGNRTYFDGQGKTLSNFVITNNSGNAGLFAGTFDIKDLNVDNANVTGKYAGVISGNMYGNIDNCTVKNSTVNNSYWQGGALVGQYNSGNVTNCTVENCKISGGAAIGGLIGVLNETTGVRKIENCTVKNCEMNMTNGFGGNWDKMFGVVVGYVNINNSTVILNCTLENNKLNGEASDLLFGVAHENNTITINSNPYVTAADELKAAVAAGATKVYLADGEYDLNGNQKDGLTLVGVGDNVKVANTTKYASGKATGAIWQAIHLENVTITNTVYTMADGGNSTFKNVNFAAGFRQGYGKNVVFTDCTFGCNTEGYALHFQTDSASEGGLIALNGCEFEGGKVHLGGKRAYAFTGCDFAAGTDFQVWSNVTLENCTVDGEKVTADNMNTLFPKLDATKVTLK